MHTDTWKSERVPAVIFILLALACTAPIVLQPGEVAFWPRAQYSDLLLTHLPNAQLAHDALFRWGQLPLWNPLLFSGMPLAADPLAGLAYPPNWLTVLFPAAASFNLLFVLHLAWAGLGAFKLARAQGYSRRAAYAAGIVFAAGTRFAMHISLGHIGLVSAVSWTGWALLAWRRLLTLPEGKTARLAAIAGACLAASFLADPRWTIPLGLLVLANGVHLLLVHGRERPLSALGKDAGLALVFSLALCASLLLPLVELTLLSTRTAIPPGGQELFSLRPVDLLGAAVLQAGEPELFLYFGVAALLLGLVGLSKREQGSLFWAGTFGIAILLALGSYTPVYGWFRALVPGAGLLRVPARFLFLAGFALAMLAARGVQALETPSGFPKGGRLAGFAFAGLVLALNAALLFSRGLPRPVSLAPLLGAGCGLVLLLAGRRLFRRQAAYTAAWLIVLSLELAWVDTALLEPRAATSEAGQTARMLAGEMEPGSGRVFSPTFSLPPLDAVDYGLQQVEGVSPLQLDSYRDYLAGALGFPVDGYSVTLPPQTWFDERMPAQNVDFPALGRLNIAFVITASAWSDRALAPAESPDDLYIYWLEDPRPRAWVVPAGAQADGAWKPVDSLAWSPNRILLTATGPGQLVLSEVDYPGWTVRVDGVDDRKPPAEGLFRSAALGPGEHRIEFVFRPWSVFAGWLVSAAALAALIWLARRR